MSVDVLCKLGKLHVTDDTVSVTNFGKLIWSAARADVREVIKQTTGLNTADLTIIARTGLYSAPMLTKGNAAKVLACFPGIVRELPTGDLWYLDPVRRTYLATYTSDADAQRDLEAAAQNGWMPQDTTGTAGHINVGRTAAKVAVLGPLALVTGASRSKDKLTITFVRTPEWLAAHSSQ